MLHRNIARSTSQPNGISFKVERYQQQAMQGAGTAVIIMSSTITINSSMYYQICIKWFNYAFLLLISTAAGGIEQTTDTYLFADGSIEMSANSIIRVPIPI